MGFFMGMIMGMAAGVGLVFCFARWEISRSKERMKLADTIAAFARMGLEDSRKILPKKLYPSWIVFSERQKLDWLNQHLMKIWPYVNQAASELIKASVEPTLEEYRPAILKSMKFSKLTLGTVAPHFSGIWILDDDDSESITMEFEVQWDGNPNIELDIRTKLGVSLPVQVRDIAFTGVFRLIFKPLVEELPCFGAVTFSMREKKMLNYTLKVVKGDVSAIPGIKDAIDTTINSALEDSLIWPVRIIIPIIPGDYSNLELKPVGTLEVKLIQAKNLTNKDLVGKSDPFVKLYVRPTQDKIKRSKTKNNDLNPIWNEHFEFIVEDVSTQKISMDVYDDEGVQASELIGCAQLELKKLEPGKMKDMWLKLVKDSGIRRDTKDRGEVQVELLYCPFGMENEIANPFSNQDSSMTSLEKVYQSVGNAMEAPNTDLIGINKKQDVIVRGVLSVTVISGEDLPSMDLRGKADPYVVLKMKKSDSKNKTRVVNKSVNPIWNQSFDFVVEDGRHDLLMLELYDHDTFGRNFMGRYIMTLTRVIMETEFEDTYPLEDAKSGRLTLRLKWTGKPIYREQ